jgi:cytosine/adenosine deaminase-related metal-dependent hydrolase
LGLEHRIGSLDPGKRADVVRFGGTVELAAIHDPYQQLVYAASPRTVSDVWVDGARLVADGELTRLDEREQVERCRPLAVDLAVASGLVDQGLSWLATT